MHDQIILIVGSGNMGSAIAQGLIDSEYPASLILCDHDTSRHSSLKNRFQEAEVIQTIKQLIQNPTAIILAVKPQDLRPICTQLAAELTSQTPLYLSVAAGVPCQTLMQWLGANARLVRAMPNTPAAIGLGMTGLYTALAIDHEYRTVATNIMQAVGKTLWLDSEDKLDALTALSGSGPAYVFYFMECLQQAGISLGLSTEESRTLVQQTLIGSAQLANQTTPFTELRQNVTSKGGTTERALNALTERDLEKIIILAVTYARDRAREMSHRYQEEI